MQSLSDALRHVREIRQTGTVTGQQMPRESEWAGCRRVVAKEELRRLAAVIDMELASVADLALEAHIQGCPECRGAGVIKFDVPVTDARFGRYFLCPACRRYAIELTRRELLEELQPMIDRYSALRGELLRKNLNSKNDTNPDGFKTSKEIAAAHKAIVTWVGMILRVDNYTAPPGVFLWGTPGTGKTHLLAGAANKLAGYNWPVIFCAAPDILAMLRGKDFDVQEEIIDVLRNIPVLVIDDLGAESATEWTGQVFFRIIDYRYSEGAPTLISSNLAPDMLAEKRLASRVMDTERYNVQALKTDDYRRKQK